MSQDLEGKRNLSLVTRRKRSIISLVRVLPRSTTLLVERIITAYLGKEMNSEDDDSGSNLNVDQSQDLDLSQMVLLDWHLNLQRLRGHSSPTTAVKMKLLLTASWLRPLRYHQNPRMILLMALLMKVTLKSAIPNLLKLPLCNKMHLIH